ncbi:kinase-like domain-containing protein [Mycena latifolia]|nr:kinase-like domain-containing protein [Mycena latifolia]
MDKCECNVQPHTQRIPGHLKSESEQQTCQISAYFAARRLYGRNSPIQDRGNEDPAWSKLGDLEQIWARFQPWLEARGYMLRPRYRPGWSLPFETCPALTETAIPGEGEVLDATRISDGAPVVIKIVLTVSPDTDISGFLTREPGAEAYTLPILDLLPFNDERSFMVMPRMRDCDCPAFETVSEVMEFVQQVLEGLVFLHSRNIAHRDICLRNMVMDSSRMIPGGFHFIYYQTSDGQHLLRPYTGDDSDPRLIKSRAQAGPVKYYYIDFGLSVRFPCYEARKLVVGECGRLRKRIPEISETVPYDPFKVDIRLVGEMLRCEFLVDYTGLDFLVPFVRKLRRHDPAERPDAPEALALFEHYVSKLSAKDLAQPIKRSFCMKKIRRRRMILFMKGLGLH